MKLHPQAPKGHLIVGALLILRSLGAAGSRRSDWQARTRHRSAREQTGVLHRCLPSR